MPQQMMRALMNDENLEEVAKYVEAHDIAPS